MTTSRRLRKRDETRQQILTAASSLFAVRGYFNTSIDDIADLADLARGTVFYHFESKEALVTALRFRSVEEACCLSLSRLQTGQSALAVLKFFMTLTFEWTERNLELARVLFSEGPPMLKETARKSSGVGIFRPPPLVPRQLVEAAQMEGTLRAELDPDFVTHLLTFVLIHGQLDWIERPSRKPAAVAVDELLFDLLTGLSPRP
ncbi:MAG: TetR/AcrR family transcriptional regulator [Candidatus Obscuribacter sp.]|nr:TetR/AcrR family transcriptional regulator [Candidatus Obscuribacter sp.]MBK9279468.1 TetR/AcrR family transcriptional regulator [Candidatus Obscuribacter sp.]MBL8081455.1 TetR/AcrR family transcriptional regulator [Candidatus Obscuribacter sp.]